MTARKSGRPAFGKSRHFPTFRALIAFCVFRAADGITDYVNKDSSIDVLFGTKCEAKCWNEPGEKQLMCIKSCLDTPWKKPGECPSAEPSSVPSLEKPCINSCKIDKNCTGILKCCQHSCGITCQTPLYLEFASGLSPKPENITIKVNRENFLADGLTLTLYWTTKSEFNQTLYLVEERHHVGKRFIEERLGDWIVRKRTTHNKVTIKNLYKPGRWYQFRVTAINENGTQGPSEPSEPFFSSSAVKLPGPPQNLKVGATSMGKNKLHLQLVWDEPVSDLPIHRYKVTWSRLKNFTLVQYHHTLPPITTYFWLHDLDLDTDYFLQVQAFAKFGRKKLVGESSSIVFNTANLQRSGKSSRQILLNKNEKINLKYKRRIKNFSIDRVYWLHDQLLAHVSWNPVKKLQYDYSISWSHNRCHEHETEWYIAKTDLSYFEVYDLEPECEYSISIKAVRRQTLFVANKTFSTKNCIKDTTYSDDNIIVNCPI